MITTMSNFVLNNLFLIISLNKKISTLARVKCDINLYIEGYVARIRL